MAKRSETMRRDRERQAAARIKNHPRKLRERERREARMIERLKHDGPPHPPFVMSWLSRKLDKKASRITEDDIKALVAQR